MRGYKTIAAAITGEFLEKRSRFIYLAAPVRTQPDAARLIDSVRAAHREANHNCYAYILREGYQRYSDDGEPQGTAGIPILEVIRHRELVDVGVVVTRYFGGTLLGAGGLVRAYSQGASLAVGSAKVISYRPCTIFTLTLPYPVYGRFQSLFSAIGGKVLEENFAQNITLKLRVQTKNFAMLEKQLANISAGSVKAAIVGEEFAAD